MPPAIRAAEVVAVRVPSSTPIEVITTTSGSAVAM